MVGSKPNHEDLEKNTDVKVKLSGKGLSLVDAIKELEQQNELSEPRIEGYHWAFHVPNHYTENEQRKVEKSYNVIQQKQKNYLTTFTSPLTIELWVF